MSDATTVKEEGLKLYRAGRYEDAAAKFVEAQQAFASEGNPKEVAECANNRGVCWRQAAKFDEATAAFEEARPLFQGLNDLVGEGQVVGNLAAWWNRRATSSAPASFIWKRSISSPKPARRIMQKTLTRRSAN